MKKVLIIANLYHASPRISGIATYLFDFGWEATIVTPSVKDAENKLGFPEQFLERVKIVEANYRGDIFWFWRKIFKLFGFKTNESITEQIKERASITSKRSLVDLLMNWYQTIFAYPDTEIPWHRPALKIAKKILEKEKFDMILSSSPFPTSHIIASEMKRKYKIPWIADFRDLWTQNHNYPFNKLRKIIEEKLEKKTLKNADSAVTVSPLLAEKQKKLLSRDVEVITNGFDQNSFNSIQKLTPAAKKLIITYTGNIYVGKQDPSLFFAAVENLIKQKKIESDKIEINFFGPRQKWINDLIIKYNLKNVVKQHGTVPRRESILKQKESQLLLLLNWEDKTEKGVYTSKIFEYLASQRPIIASGGFRKDEVERILNETNAGIYATTVEEIESALLNFYEEYKHNGRVSYNGDLKEISKYSYRQLAGNFAEILKGLT